MTEYKIDGYVVAGYESVQAQFEEFLRDGLEENIQLCVYVGGQVVIDLCGSRPSSKDFHGDTLVNVFSSTKSLAAICMALLVEKNLMSYSDKVVQYWLEYGNGDELKQSLTIADILRHQGGMPLLFQTVKLVDLLRENIKNNSIGSIIEKEPLKFPPETSGTKTQYHALTRGWILNEIFRRIDPARRTIGECLAEEICTPLNADCYIGLPYDHLSRVAPLSTSSLGNVVTRSMVPKMFGRKTTLGFGDFVKYLAVMKNAGGEGESAPIAIETMKSNTAMEEIVGIYGNSVVQMGELPSVNGNCSARGLAKIAAMMANKGTLDGVQILSEETWGKFHAKHEPEELFGLGMPCQFSDGGVNYFSESRGAGGLEWMAEGGKNRSGYVGWMGLGGSVFQWNVDHDIGFGFVPTRVSWDDMNLRGALLQKLVVDCVVGLKGE